MGSVHLQTENYWLTAKGLILKFLKGYHYAFFKDFFLYSDWKRARVIVDIKCGILYGANELVVEVHVSVYNCFWTKFLWILFTTFFIYWLLITKIVEIVHSNDSHSIQMLRINTLIYFLNITEKLFSKIAKFKYWTKQTVAKLATKQSHF